MSSIDNLMIRTCAQTAVYWGNPVDTGDGGKTFDDPIELTPPNGVRWEEMTQVVSDAKGEEFTSRAVIYSVQDLDEEGMLYLGTLDDLYDSLESSLGALDDPRSIEGAYTIRRFQKTPMLHSSTAFLRKSFLTPSLSFGGF